MTDGEWTEVGATMYGPDTIVTPNENSPDKGTWCEVEPDGSITSDGVIRVKER